MKDFCSIHRLEQSLVFACVSPLPMPNKGDACRPPKPKNTPTFVSRYVKDENQQNFQNLPPLPRHKLTARPSRESHQPSAPQSQRRISKTFRIIVTRPQASPTLTQASRLFVSSSSSGKLSANDLLCTYNSPPSELRMCTCYLY